MKKEDNLTSRINRHIDTMSKGQKKLAGFILANYDRAVFMTAAKMGKTVGVSESTVVRFATLLEDILSVRRQWKALCRKSLIP